MLHVDKFEIDYREDGSERQFSSDLSIIDPETGRTVSTQHINVNKPLRYGGVTACALPHHAYPLANHATSHEIFYLGCDASQIFTRHICSHKPFVRQPVDVFSSLLDANHACNPLPKSFSKYRETTTDFCFQL